MNGKIVVPGEKKKHQSNEANALILRIKRGREVKCRCAVVMWWWGYATFKAGRKGGTGPPKKHTHTQKQTQNKQEISGREDIGYIKIQ